MKRLAGWNETALVTTPSICRRKGSGAHLWCKRKWSCWHRVIGALFSPQLVVESAGNRVFSLLHFKHWRLLRFLFSMFQPIWWRWYSYTRRDPQLSTVRCCLDGGNTLEGVVIAIMYSFWKAEKGKHLVTVSPVHHCLHHSVVPSIRLYNNKALQSSRIHAICHFPLNPKRW